MSAIYQKIREAEETLQELEDLYDYGLATSAEVHAARRRVGNLRWERDFLTPQPAAVEIEIPVLATA